MQPFSLLTVIVRSTVTVCRTTVRQSLKLVFSMLVCIPALTQAADVNAHSPESTASVGYDRFDVPAAHRSRDLGASIWYPALNRGYQTLVGDNPVFVGEPALQGPAPRAVSGGRPLLVLSHGSGGSIDTLAWLANPLVASGAVVVGVNHAGSTSGDSSPRRSLRHWERTQDISALLDTVLADTMYGPLIDPERITVLGFSLGGATSLGVGGAQLSHADYQAYCEKRQPQPVDCRFFAISGVDLASLPTGAFEASAREPRVDAVIAVDPAFSYAMTDNSLAQMHLPVLLINLGEGENRWPAIDLSADGSNLAGRLPRVRYEVVPDGNHFTFLAVCKPDAPALLTEEGEDPICDDPVGVDRAASHRRLADIISAFVQAPAG